MFYFHRSKQLQTYFLVVAAFNKNSAAAAFSVDIGAYIPENLAT